MVITKYCQSISDTASCPVTKHRAKNVRKHSCAAIFGGLGAGVSPVVDLVKSQCPSLSWNIGNIHHMYYFHTVQSLVYQGSNQTHKQDR